MSLIAMVDELLRNRRSLYRQAQEGDQLRVISLRLLWIFLICTAIYGGVMGAFRSIHPAFFFSDFELVLPGETAIRGEIAGMMTEYTAVYTRTKLPVGSEGRSIRFNLTDPSDPCQVTSISEEKGYYKIQLAPGTMLSESDRWLLPAIVAGKIPLLFLLTLAVCAFALYILNLALGMQLRFVPIITLMLFALAGTGIMLLVFAPISLLFSVVTTSYHFMKILHVVVFIIAGLFGVRILGEGLIHMHEHLDDVEKPEAGQAKARAVLVCWLLLYCLVGAQIAWTLKPFLGTPYLPATPPFRLERGNIFVSTLESLRDIRPSE